MQCRDLFPVATKDERDENKDRVEPELHVCWWVEVGGAATVTVVHPSGEKAWSMVHESGVKGG